jgi:hypothetical protein
MDPIITPLLVLVLGNLARDLIADACKDYLKDKLKSVFGWLESSTDPRFRRSSKTTGLPKSC